jgi:hypothetical protein
MLCVLSSLLLPWLECGSVVLRGGWLSVVEYLCWTSSKACVVGPQLERVQGAAGHT